MGDNANSNSEPKKWIRKRLQQSVLLHRRGESDTALTGYLDILAIDPEHADANHLAGLALLARKQPSDLKRSLDYLQKAVCIDDGQSTFHNDLGNVYWNLGRIVDAAAAFSKAIELDSSFVQPRFNLGNCYWMQGEFGCARQAYADALNVNEDWAQARYMLANCEYTLGNTKHAIAIFRDVIAKRPELTDARLGLAYALLRDGQWLEGWSHFENRLTYPEFAAYRALDCPQWDGRDIHGKTLLVCAEQGIGDTLHFLRYLPWVKLKVGRLVLACDRGLHKLLVHRAEVDELIELKSVTERWSYENFDYRISLMSLPGLFETTTSNLPHKSPYLEVDKRQIDAWRRRLDPKKLNIGLAWAGNPSQKEDQFRSCALEALLPLMRISHIRWYSLQVGPGRQQINETDCVELVDLADELENFADTAALISALDLVVSVDTAAAHLAGALGKPVWAMLWHSHCWRYLENRSDSPWYPTMRLFRQRRIGDWESVVAQIETALAQFQEQGILGRNQISSRRMRTI